MKLISSLALFLTTSTTEATWWIIDEEKGSLRNIELKKNQELRGIDVLTNQQEEAVEMLEERLGDMDNQIHAATNNGCIGCVEREGSSN